ncbi:MAG TPA: FG-GAP-like repeat-containing protein [Pyrinomonadaceae bacterium]|nr:FG-GAP-like repeat-containing protein [Pyrinomonadaceae bacterium]
MKSLLHSLALSLALTGLLATTPAARNASARLQNGASLKRRASAADAREQAYRANNLGVALLEQFKYREGAEEFRRALRLDPQLALARINLAIALYNLPDPAGAESEARAAASAAPDAPQPQYILGLVAKSQSRTDEAVAAFRRVLRLDPEDVGANVNLGQLYAQQRDYKEAIAAFRTALAAEPYNGTALYNLGTSLLRAGQREEGQRVMARFQQLRQLGSATTIGQNYLEQGRYAEAVASTGAEADLVERRTPEVVFKDVTASTLPPAAPGAWPVRDDFIEQSGGAIVLFDFDGDGQLDLLEVAGGRQRLYRNDHGKFTDVTAQTGALAKESGGVATAAVAGDYDNDGRPDLFVLRYGQSTLYHNDGGGHFTDTTAAARIPNYPYFAKSAAFVDYDHDGDLDLFIAGGFDAAKALKEEAEAKKKGGAGKPAPITEVPPGLAVGRTPAPSLLLRNNGDGTFTDVTAAAKLSDPFNASAVVPTDFDNRRDVDLLVASNVGTPALWRNMRDGTFRNVSAEVGLEKGELVSETSVAAGDVNKDGFTDFYFGRGSWGTFAVNGPAGYFALSDGKGHFRLEPGPATPSKSRTLPFAGASTEASQFLDYDNDGLLDLLSVVTVGHLDDPHLELRVWRNEGDGWEDVSDKAAPGIRAEISAKAIPLLARARVLVSGDLDGDGDTDIIFGVPGGGLRVLRNDGGNRNASVRVQLAGKVSNRSGVEAKVELRAGSLRQKLETYAASPAPAPADLIFGLGRRASADAVRVLWPSGVVQAETESAKAAQGQSAQTFARIEPGTLKVMEVDRKPSSCPYLYAWDGSRFRFITDFMGGGEMGYLEEPGRYNVPDPDEYVRIRGDQLREREGRYELRVTNELEETMFVDRLQLIAVAHPSEVEVYPNEGMSDPPRPFHLYKTRGAHPPLSAVDDHGHDVLAKIVSMDRQYPDDFRRDPVRGYADEHTLTLKLDEGVNAGARTLLLLTGWTDYAWSSDNVAASQAGKEMRPPSLQVRDARGEWKTVIEDIGIPVGRPQTVTVDLTGKFLSASREVRIVTNMRALWDQILVDTSGGDFPAQLTKLDPVAADLHWRGFSKEVTPDGREPFGYDYTQVSFASPWKTMPGRYTREGDVRELLLASDDMFVISRPGDEISLSFDATRLPPLPAGWTRTFLLYADGFSKEMDINSASPDQVAPLPFHGMTKYPYQPPESYPQDTAHRAYQERYNTRVVASEVSSIDSILLDSLRSGAVR